MAAAAGALPSEDGGVHFASTRVTTIWTTMLAGSRTEKIATLPRLPEELWLYMFGFLKHEEQPAFQ